MEYKEQLCLACGLCCDGALFGHVRLGSKDDPKKIKSLGLPVTVSRSRPPLVRFRQPCAALCADGKCRVYSDRPAQCRSFECRVFQNLEAGRIEFAAALRLVRQARRKAGRVRQLLRDLGDADEHRSLSERFQRAQSRMEAGTVNADEGHLFAELTQAMHALQLLAHDSFYIRAGEAPSP